LSFDDVPVEAVDVVEADDSVALPVTAAPPVSSPRRTTGGYESIYFQTSHDTTKKPMTVPQ
jgi:hypothetical protein